MRAALDNGIQAGAVEFALAAPDYLKASEKGAGDTVVSPTTGTIEEVDTPRRQARSHVRRR